MQLFLDECISPEIALTLNAEGEHVVRHPRDIGALGEADHRVLRRCIDDNFVVVTQNAGDFRRLVGREVLHPGLIILPNLNKLATESLLRAAIAHLAERGNPMDVMLNHVLEMSEDNEPQLDELAAIEARHG